MKKVIEKVYTLRLPTEYGDFTMHVFGDRPTGILHFALTMGLSDVHKTDRILVRIHSQCFTGDALGSHRCDCGWQLREAQRRIAESGRGVLIYLTQEGRGIGLEAKLHSYQVQDELGLDTVDANLQLGYPIDSRTYEAAVDILHILGQTCISLLTNNPAKIEALRAAGIDVERLALEPYPNKHNQWYLVTKAAKLGHLLSNSGPDVPSKTDRSDSTSK